MKEDEKNQEEEKKEGNHAQLKTDGDGSQNLFSTTN